MTLDRRGLLALTAGTLAAPRLARAAWAPDRPISFQVGFPPGGNIDYVARLLAKELTPRLGQSVVVENRTGASGNLATQAMLRAPADGHTIGFAAIHLATNPFLVPLGYDPAEIDPLTQIGDVPVLFLASDASGLRDVAAAVAAAKAAKGDITFSSGGIGTSSHLAAELFARRAGFAFTHVPFRGGGPSMQALLAGQTALSFTVAEAAIPENVAAGKIRGLAVMQRERLAAMPDMPSIAEAGYGPEVFISSWHGVMLRAGTPQPARERLFAAIADAVRGPDMAQGLRRAAIEPAVSESPAAFKAFVQSETERWGKVIREAGITAQ